MSVIEMVVDEKDDREVHKVGKVVTKEWGKAEVLKLEFGFVLAAEIIQVSDSIAWVCCASCKVYWHIFQRFSHSGLVHYILVAGKDTHEQQHDPQLHNSFPIHLSRINEMWSCRTR